MNQNLAKAGASLQLYVLALLRVVAGYTFLLYGTSKLFGAPYVAMFDGLQLFSLTGLAGVLELLGGALLVLGAFTRPVAFLLSGRMALAYFMAHTKTTDFWLPLMDSGGSVVLFCFIFLYLAVAGGGFLALDRSRS
ncbi:MAG: DoxX family protein [Lautropia sp.]|nr:DoxX family protein [Lautropia sp.]